MSSKYDSIIEAASDRSSNGIALAQEVVEDWGCDLSSRKLRTTLDEDGAKVTEVDAMALFIELARTKKIINLPDYTNARPSTVKEGTVLVSRTNRHGPVLNLSSNKAVFSAGLMTKDANVVTTDEVGAYRTFMLTDLNGELDMERWSTVEILTQDPAIPDRISLTCMVNPGRWASIYGRPYIAAKALMIHLDEKVKDLTKQVSALKFRQSNGKTWGSKTTQVGGSTSIMVDAFEAVLDGFELHGEFEQYSRSAKGLQAAESALKDAKRLLRMLQFLTRMTEKAFYDHAVKPRLGGSLSGVLKWVENGGEQAPTVATWKKGTWVCGYKPTAQSRTRWARMEMLPGIHLRWRVWSKRETVSVEYTQ